MTSPESWPSAIPSPRDQLISASHSFLQGNDTQALRVVPVDRLLETAKGVSYLWEGVLPARGLSILAGKPKSGKSTFIRFIMLAVTPYIGVTAQANKNEALGRAVDPTRVLYLSLEDSVEIVADHFRKLGVPGPGLDVWVGGITGDPLVALEATLAEGRYGLVVIDTMIRFTRFSNADNYSETSGMMDVLSSLAQHYQCHIMLVHHLRKGASTGGEGILGSTGLFAAVDTALLIEPVERYPDLRHLTTIQRFGRPLDLTVRYDDATGQFQVVDVDLEKREQQRATDSEYQALILGLLKDSWHTETELRHLLRLDNRRAARVLRVLLAEGKVARKGRGRKGDPYIYGPTDDREVKAQLWT